MKRIHAFIFLIFLSCAMLPIAFSVSTPISSCQQLQDINSRLDGNYVLTQDINCYADTHLGGALWNFGNGFTPIGVSEISSFSGTFDGNGHVIYGLYFGAGKSPFNLGGLFGYIKENAFVGNVGLKEIDINTKYQKFSDTMVNVGALVVNNRGIISNCYVEGNITRNQAAQSMGGLVSKNYGTILNSYFSGNIIVSNEGTQTGQGMGGLVGVSYGVIKNSHSSGKIIIINNAGAYSYINDVGGLVGINYGPISKSYSNLDINIDAQRGVITHVGGLVGLNVGNNAKISESYSSGNIFTSNNIGNYDWYIGGLVGMDYGVDGPNEYSILDCYSTSSITTSKGKYVGGLVGQIIRIYFTFGEYFGRVKNSYSIGNIIGEEYVGGLVGNIDDIVNSKVINSFSTGNVTANKYGGGLAGYIRNPLQISNSFYSGLPNNGAGTKVDLASYFYPQVGLGGDYNAPIQHNSVATNDWNFSGVWEKVDGNYPILDWQTDTVVPDLFLIEDIKFSPIAPRTSDDVNVLFEVMNGVSGSVTCNVAESQVSETKTDLNPKFNLYLGKFNVGTYPITISCENSKNSKQVIVYLKVVSLPDVIIDANVSLTKFVDDGVEPIVVNTLTTRFSSGSSVLSQIKNFINNSANLRVSAEGIYRILVDFNSQKYYSNYFLVGDQDPVCGDGILVPDCDEGMEPAPSVDENNCPIMICVPIVVTVTDCWDETTSPHPICTLSDLNRVREHSDWNYLMQNNIDASATQNWNYVAAHCRDWQGTNYFDINKEVCEAKNTIAVDRYWWVVEHTYGFEPIRGGMRGRNVINFNGGNYTISNLFADQRVYGGSTTIGLFSYINGTFENLNLTDINMFGNGAGLIGHCSDNCLINNVHVTGTVDATFGGAMNGGLVGNFSGGFIKNSSFEGTVIAAGSNVGGLVGSSYGSIEKSYSKGNVIGTSYVGGLVGQQTHNYSTSKGGSISESYSESNVFCNIDGRTNPDDLLYCFSFGGLVGYSADASVTNSYSIGDVNGYHYISGLVGVGGTITNSYSTGKVTGSINVNGLASVTTTGCYWDTQTSGQATSAGGTGKTTLEMKTPSTFVGWNTSVWKLVQGEYPKLAWREIISGQEVRNCTTYQPPICPDGQVRAPSEKDVYGCYKKGTCIPAP